MTEPAPTDQPPLNSQAFADNRVDPARSFAKAWDHIQQARARLQSLGESWNQSCSGAFDARIINYASGSGEIVVDLDFDDSTRALLNSTARKVGVALRRALDDGVRALADLVSGVLITPNPATVRFPLAASRETFLAAYRLGVLDGVRPDHVQFIEALQPFDTVSPYGMGPFLEFLRQLTETPSDSEIVTAWAHMARPEVSVEPPSEVKIVSVDPDGPITTSKRIATFQVVHPVGLDRWARPQVIGNPNVAFDLMAAVGGPPNGPDDTFSGRGRSTIAVVTAILESFERSVGLRQGVVDSWNPVARFTGISGPSWAPLRSDQDRAVEVQQAAQQSEIGLATLSDGQELTLVISTGDETYLRRVAAATALDPRLRQGTAAEKATISAAARWGLPDFVFPPVKRKLKSGIREISDGMVVVGERALILQVKSRERPSDDAQSEERWIRKKADEGARQARGTLRQLRLQPAELANQRGRVVTIDGNSATWVGTVIIDHPAPPPAIELPGRYKGLPIVTLLRRDWEFLFEQLGSTAAVVAYLHRVAGETCSLGNEATAYYELAGRDAAASPTPPRNGWAAETGSIPHARPLLPLTPATAGRGNGRAMFRTLLEDLSRTQFDDEHSRLLLLALLDQTQVDYQADVGDRLLELLSEARQTAIGTVSWGFRWILDTQHPRQAGFGVSNQLSKWHNDAFRTRILLQHHRMTRHDWDAGDNPTTIGVLLTPNYYRRDRLWDTTVIATIGPSDLEPDEIAAFGALWSDSE